MSFVVCDETPAGWTSVIAEGHVETLAESTVDAEVEAATRRLDIPHCDVHDRPERQLEFEICRLQPTRLSGIVEGPGQ